MAQITILSKSRSNADRAGSLFEHFRFWASGPGGLYNLGNGLGLASGLAMAILPARFAVAEDADQILKAIANYFMGDLAAISLSIAMLIFFYSGLLYDRAWSNGAPPIKAFNRSGDLWSGFGALFLGVGLFHLGQPVLAATAGLLHAIGKFGSAWVERPIFGYRDDRMPDIWRTTVLISRIPALLAALLAIAECLTRYAGVELLTTLVPSGTLLACYALWVWADLKLFRS